jgi:hypothetical protein
MLRFCNKAVHRKSKVTTTQGASAARRIASGGQKRAFRHRAWLICR